MKVNGTPYRSIWLNDNGWSADIIDQTRLPHEFVIKTLTSMVDAAEAISVMRVRGAPLIGATAAGQLHAAGRAVSRRANHSVRAALVVLRYRFVAVQEMNAPWLLRPGQALANGATYIR